MKNVKDHLKRQDRSTVGVNERTIRWHCNEFFKNKLYQPESRQGKYEKGTAFTMMKTCHEF